MCECCGEDAVDGPGQLNLLSHVLAVRQLCALRRAERGLNKVALPLEKGPDVARTKVTNFCQVSIVTEKDHVFCICARQVF